MQSPQHVVQRVWYPQCQPVRALHWSLLLPQKLHLRVKLVGSQRQTLQQARCSFNRLRIGMQQIVEVDRVSQRLSTYFIGHKQGIHPAQRNVESETFVCYAFARSAGMQPSMHVQCLSHASSSCKQDEN